MGAVMNGMSVSGVLPAGGTFFVFSDYMRPAVRLAALSQYKTAFVWTHDSIGVGEDGPTHQPIEHLASLRAMPELNVIRPADANECRGRHGGSTSTASIPPRSSWPARACPCSPAPPSACARGLPRGAYVLVDEADAGLDIVLIGTGSEVSLCVDARDLLAADGPLGAGRVVSVLGAVRGATRRRTAIRCSRRACRSSRSKPARASGWERYADDVVAIDHFGASAPGGTAMKEFGFTPENVAARA